MNGFRGDNLNELFWTLKLELNISFLNAESGFH